MNINFKRKSKNKKYKNKLKKNKRRYSLKRNKFMKTRKKIFHKRRKTKLRKKLTLRKGGSVFDKLIGPEEDFIKEVFPGGRKKWTNKKTGVYTWLESEKNRAVDAWSNAKKEAEVAKRMQMEWDNNAKNNHKELWGKRQEGYTLVSNFDNFRPLCMSQIRGLDPDDPKITELQKRTQNFVYVKNTDIPALLAKKLDCLKLKPAVKDEHVT
tara:strand:- start:784 stop:1413 length:630 start_codon:yes stop_codon:yes gene_type:complete